MSIEVPLDHRANDPSKKLKLSFAVSFASEQSKGVLFYAVGGPGGSGLGVADDYLSAFDERLAQNMDIVFFDQRGVGAEHGVECPIAQGAFDSVDLSVDAPDAAIETAKHFVTDCMAELKSKRTPALRGYRAGHSRHGDVPRGDWRAESLDVWRELWHPVRAAIRHGLSERDQRRDRRWRG